MASKFNDCHFYAVLGLSAPTWHDENLGVNICWELKEVAKECVLQEAHRRGSHEELLEDAANFFGEEPIFYRDEEGELVRKYFS